LVLNVLLAIFFQVVGDRKGAVFGGLVEAPLRPSNKRKYQVRFYFCTLMLSSFSLCDNVNVYFILLT